MAKRIYETGALEQAQLKSNQELAVKTAEHKKLAEKLRTEKKVEVIGAPMYRAWFGNMMHISINGVPIFVPLDGKRYSIPESYAEIFNTRIRSVNDDIAMEKVRSNVQSNAESYPGELDLVKPV